MTKKSVKSSKEVNTKSNNPKKANLTIKDLKEKIKGEEEKYLRLFAEFENYKKRTTKERIDLYKTAGKEVILCLMPVLEDFKRALNQETGKFDHTEGISLIYNKL
jgi:molecular chaperone GrpE